MVDMESYPEFTITIIIYNIPYLAPLSGYFINGPLFWSYRMALVLVYLLLCLGPGIILHMNRNYQ